MPQVGEIFSAGVDWITATFREDDAGAAALKARCWQHFEQVRANGGKVESIRPLKYEGYRAENVFFGSRHDGHMFQATSTPANVWFLETLKYGCQPHITRLDLEVTAYRATGDYNFAPRYRNMIRRFERRMGRKRSLRLDAVDKNLSGDSVRIGARTSEFSMDVYDKSDEQKGLVPPDLTRFESENKGDLGAELWRQLREGTSPQELAKSHNLARLLKVGVKPEWADHAVPQTFTPAPDKSDDYRRIMWLANDVSRTVKGLVERGFHHEVISALGLEEVIEMLAQERVPGIKQARAVEQWQANSPPPRLETFLTPDGAREILRRRDQERDKRTTQRLRKIAERDEPKEQ